MAKKKNKVLDLENERYGLFMSENSFDLDVAYGRNFIQTDNAQSVIIHRVNIVKSKSHSLYAQTKSKDKSFFPPVRINVMVTVQSSSQSYLGDSGGIVREDTGNIEFGVYLEELNEKQIEVNRGDYVEYNMSGDRARYYEIESSNNIEDTTDKTIGGFKPYWKKIIAVPVREDTIDLYNGGTKGY